MRPIHKKLARDLWRLKGQVVTIALLVSAGVLTLISSVSTYASMRKARDEYFAEYHFGHLFNHVKRAPLSLASDIARLPGVDAVQARIIDSVFLDFPKSKEPVVAQMVSLDTRSAVKLNDIFLRRGRLPEPDSSDEVLVHESFAVAHALHPGDALTAVINGHRVRMTIVGIAISPEYIFQPPIGGQMAGDDKHVALLWLPYDALSAMFNMQGAFNDFSLRLARGANQEKVIALLDRVMAPYGGQGAYGRADQFSARTISDELTQLKVLGTVGPAIFLSVVAFLLNVLMSRQVSTQREQIATLKALGYGHGTLALHYVLFALAIVMLGVLLGTALGVWLGYGMTRLYTLFFRFPIIRYILDAKLVALSFAIVTTAALLGVLQAVKRVTSLEPAEAMRPPAPGNFSRSFIERKGLDRWLGMIGRMTFRNVRRRPLRLLLSVLGLSLATAVILIGSFSVESIRYLLNVEFGVVWRSDVTVGLSRPVSAGACDELLHIPGVLQCETSRSMPVRLRFGHRSRKTILMGLSDASELRRIMDRDLRVTRVPRQSVVLPLTIARAMGVRAGDRVQLEVLEGQRPVMDVFVAEVVDEMIGMALYMNSETVSALMDEKAAASLALLSIEKTKTTAIWERLKKLPWVSSVTLQSQTLKNFEEVNMRWMLVQTAILTVLACLIAIGVVYNGARIELSEHARELATLHILGFSWREVSAILFTELGIQLFLGVPLGLWIGISTAKLLLGSIQTESLSLPLVIGFRTYALSVGGVFVATAGSALIVRRMLSRIQVVSVLKSWE